MNLKNLVPPLELCKKIPAGEFAESALMCEAMLGMASRQVLDIRIIPRQKITNNPYVDRKLGREYYIYPAPTLHEIMAELSLCDEYCDTGWFCMVGDPDHWSIGNCECDLYVRNGTESDSPEAAALKVWLKMKGIDCEQKQS